MLAPRSRSMKACGALSRPSTIVSRALRRPLATRGATSARNALDLARPVADEEAAHREAAGDEEEHVARSGRRGFVVVARDRSARRDAAVFAHAGERRFEMIAADVVEIHVDAVGRGGVERAAVSRRPRRRVLVVDRRVEPELLGDQPTLSAEPALPTTKQPRSLASCPAMAPTAPAAPEMKTRSPGLSSATLRPTHAVMPGMPSTPR